MILFGVTTGRHEEMDWLFRGGVARFFPEQWERLRAGAPEAERDGDVVAAYARRLNDPDPLVRARAAEDWCLWESATPAWPPTTGHGQAIHRSPLCAGVRAHRHALHLAQRLAGGWESAAWRGGARRLFPASW